MNALTEQDISDREEFIMPLTEDHAIQTSSSITLLPEFHLTGLIKGCGIRQSEAATMAQELGDGVVVAGYVEEDNGLFYSSAVVLDGDNEPLNIRKSEPWGRSERSWMSGSHGPPPVLDLSIGKTLVVICVDAFETRYGATHRAEELWGSRGIEWVLVPSCWPNDIDRYLIKRGVWRLARAVGGARWMVSDAYHGVIRSWDWER